MTYLTRSMFIVSFSCLKKLNEGKKGIMIYKSILTCNILKEHYSLNLDVSLWVTLTGILIVTRGNGNVTPASFSRLKVNWDDIPGTSLIRGERRKPGYFS